MKYFEINDPYYAVIKAPSHEEAYEKYVEVIADDDGTLMDEIEEISRDQALVLFSRSTSEDLTRMATNELLEEFNVDECSVLIMDGSLL